MFISEKMQQLIAEAKEDLRVLDEKEKRRIEKQKEEEFEKWKEKLESILDRDFLLVLPDFKYVKDPEPHASFVLLDERGEKTNFWFSNIYGTFYLKNDSGINLARNPHNKCSDYSFSPYSDRDKNWQKGIALIIDQFYELCHQRAEHQDIVDRIERVLRRSEVLYCYEFVYALNKCLTCSIYSLQNKPNKKGWIKTLKGNQIKMHCPYVLKKQQFFLSELNGYHTSQLTKDNEITIEGIEKYPDSNLYFYKKEGTATYSFQSFVTDTFSEEIVLGTV